MYWRYNLGKQHLGVLVCIDILFVAHYFSASHLSHFMAFIPPHMSPSILNT